MTRRLLPLGVRRKSAEEKTPYGVCFFPPPICVERRQGNAFSGGYFPPPYFTCGELFSAVRESRV